WNRRQEQEGERRDGSRLDPEGARGGRRCDWVSAHLAHWPLSGLSTMLIPPTTVRRGKSTCRSNTPCGTSSNLNSPKLSLQVVLIGSPSCSSCRRTLVRNWTSSRAKTWPTICRTDGSIEIFR